MGCLHEPKKLPAAADLKRPLIEPSNSHLSIRRQCELLGLNRSSYYLPPATESEEDLRLMRLIDEQFLKTPFYGSRRMTASLERSGEMVNRKRVQRLMAVMGLETLFPRPRTTTTASDARVYPYLLRDRELTHVNEVWLVFDSNKLHPLDCYGLNTSIRRRGTMRGVF